MKKKFLALVFTCLFLSGCSNFQKEKELQTKVENLEQKNVELEDKVKKLEEIQKEYERLSKINKYIEDFTAKYTNSTMFATATFNEKTNSFNIQLLEQAASDVSRMIGYKNNGKVNKNVLDLWETEITGTAIEASNNLKNINVTVKILQPLDKTKTIVEVKDGKIIKDIVK